MLSGRNISRQIGNIIPGWNTLQGNDKDGNTKSQIEKAIQTGTDLCYKSCKSFLKLFTQHKQKLIEEIVLLEL